MTMTGTTPSRGKPRRTPRRDGRRLSTQVRREQILQAAHDILAGEGYSAFTLRNIAAATGIHFATLQYHFRSKSELLSALIAFRLETDRSQLDQVAFRASGDPRERFLAGIRLITSANREPAVIGFFLQLWALANHEPMAKRATGTFYDAYFGWMRNLVTMANPGVTATECSRRALAIMAMLEGMLPTLLLNKTQRRRDKRMDGFLAEVAWKIATDTMPKR